MATTSIRSMADTWTDGGTTYNAIKMDVTDSASAAASNLLNLQVASDPKHVIGKDGATTIKSAAADALAVGLAGATNPAFQVDASTASSATGVQIKSAAAAGAVALSVLSSGTNEGLTIDAKGSGTIKLGATSTGAIEFSRAAVPTSSDGAALGTSSLMWSDLFLASGAVINFNNGDVTATHSTNTLAFAGASSGYLFDAAIRSTGATGGIGYSTGAGGAVTQATSRTTGVTLNTVSGAITLVSAAGSTTPATFTVTNSTVAATDVVLVTQKSGTDLYTLSVSAVAAGSFNITFNTKSGTTTEQPVFNFAVIKAVAA